MSISFTDAAKAKQIRELFSRFGRIYIVVDTTAGDVDVPDFLQGDPALRLILNVRMPQPIHIRDHEITSDFSFSGNVHPCRIPMSRIWSAVPADSDMQHGLTWDDDIPETIRVVMQAAFRLSEADQLAEEDMTDAAEFESHSRPQLTAIPGNTASDREPADHRINDKPAEQEQNSGRKVGHLRVVK